MNRFCDPVPDDASTLMTHSPPRFLIFLGLCLAGLALSLVPPELVARCDYVVRIPTDFCINLAMAGAIVMYDRVRCLGRFPPRPLTEGGPTGRPLPSTGRKVGRT